RAEAGAVQVYERFLRAWSLPVEPRREHALSRTGRPTDENGAARRQHDARLPGQLSDGRARSQEWIGRAPPARGAQRRFPAARAPPFQRALQYDQKGGQLDRLGEELLRAFLDGADRQIDRSVRRQHDDGEVLQPGQEIEGVAV